MPYLLIYRAWFIFSLTYIYIVIKHDYQNQIIYFDILLSFLSTCMKYSSKYININRVSIYIYNFIYQNHYKKSIYYYFEIILPVWLFKTSFVGVPKALRAGGRIQKYLKSRDEPRPNIVYTYFHFQVEDNRWMGII